MQEVILRFSRCKLDLDWHGSVELQYLVPNCISILLPALIAFTSCSRHSINRELYFLEFCDFAALR